METIKEYELAGSESPNGLVDQVNDLIENGWQPFGNAFVVPIESEGAAWYYQPMVKY